MLQMRDNHPSLDHDVPMDAVLWRYMDFPKFVSMLKERALWFSRADLLGDPLEGSFTRARAIAREELLENPPEGRTRDELADVFRHNTRITAEQLLQIYVNCWHRGTHESMALWRGYGGGPFAIAVRTNFGLLDTLLPRKFSGSSVAIGGALADDGAKPPQAMPIYLTQVRYIDHSSTTERLKDENNLYTPFSAKSLAYAHENEVRAIYWNIPAFDTIKGVPIYPGGLFIPVNLHTLITEIVVSPLAPEWFTPVVRDTFERHGFSFSIVSSLLSRDAIY